MHALRRSFRRITEAPAIDAEVESTQVTQPLSYHGNSGEAWLSTLSTLSEVMAYKQQSYHMLGLRAGMHVLDIGCGLGDDARYIAQHVAPGGKVVGVDVSYTMIASARARQQAEPGAPEVDFLVADAAHLPFEDGTFDAVRTDRMLQHVQDPLCILKETSRVLRNGCSLVLVEPDWKSISFYPGSAAGGDDDSLATAIQDWHISQVRHPTIGRQLRALLRQAGFTHVQAFAVSFATYRFAVADVALELSAAADALARAKAPVVSRRGIDAWFEAVHTADAQGQFFACIPLVFGKGMAQAATTA